MVAKNGGRHRRYLNGLTSIVGHKPLVRRCSLTRLWGFFVKDVVINRAYNLCAYELGGRTPRSDQPRPAEREPIVSSLLDLVATTSALYSNAAQIGRVGSRTQPAPECARRAIASDRRRGSRNSLYTSIPSIARQPHCNRGKQSCANAMIPSANPGSQAAKSANSRPVMKLFHNR